MREIGTLENQPDSQRFVDYLLTRQIKAQVREGKAGWGLWILNEDQLAQAKEELALFRETPDDPRYDKAVDDAKVIRQQVQRKDREFRKNLREVRGTFSDLAVRPERIPITLILMAASISVAIATNLGKDRERVGELTINRFPPAGWSRIVEPLESDPNEPQPMYEGSDHRPFAAIRQGQVWRLVTPIFLHFGLLHIVLNLLALFSLGKAIEPRAGPWNFLSLVLVVAVISNVAQYIGTSYHPLFGGMSGVICGLFGYVWMKAVTDPTSTYFLRVSTVVYFLGFLVFCGSGALGTVGVSVANVAHFTGLGVGMIVGSHAKWSRTLRLRRAR